MSGSSVRFGRARRKFLPGLATAWVCLLFLAAPWPVPTVSAQATGTEIVEADAADDVRLANPDLGPPAPNAEGLDIVKTELVGESGVSFILRVTLQDAAKEIETGDAVSNGIIVTTCFVWDGTLYAAKVRYRLGIGALLGVRVLGIVDGTCDPNQEIKFSKTVNIGDYVNLDLVRSQLIVAVDRLKLVELTGKAPAKGQTLSGLYTMINDGNRDRFDHAPEAGPSSQTVTLLFDTANLGDLTAVPLPNVAPSPCEGRVDFPTYAVEAGGTQGVPVEFNNKGAEPVEVTFEANTIGGLDWKPGVVPRLEVPPSADEGNTSVTVILHLPGAAQHKDCTIIAVRGVTAGGDIGETGVIVMAIQPPSVRENLLWLHTDPYATAADCAGKHTWLNVLEDDSDDAAQDIVMSSCRNPEVFTWNAATVVTRLDVNPNYDIELNTTAEGIGAQAVGFIRMRSSSGESNSRVSLLLQTLEGDIIATGGREVRIGSSPIDIEIPMNVEFTRDVRPDGDPSRLVRSTDGFSLTIRHEPQPVNVNVDQAKTASTVYLVSKGSHVELPIWATIKRNAHDPGDLGALVSLRAASALPEFAAPGLTRVVNFTVLNEGTEQDRILVDVGIDGVKDWTARVVPEPPFDLAPGERATFSVGVTPRPEAEESEKAFIDVVVRSERDPTARTSIAFELKATRSLGLAGDELPDAAPEGDKGGLPAPSAFAALAAVGLAALAWRRRRGH